MTRQVVKRADWTKPTCRNRKTFVVAGIAFKRSKFDGVYLACREGRNFTPAKFDPTEMPCKRRLLT